ncbi:hypothetical protein [Candidatus Binatus sp.]|uniref:hypothetical protein n=2 Tax=Candidatus Binatus sp. TaxID=2811406 RepID=UPI003C768AEB
MSDTIAPLILDFLEWIAARPRPYSEVMEVWRTSCPRLTVWEDANERGYIARRHVEGRELVVDLTVVGRRFLEESGRVAVEIADAPQHPHLPAAMRPASSPVKITLTRAGARPLPQQSGRGE